MSQELLDKVNALRTQKGFGELTLNSSLYDVCLSHSQWMEQHARLSHTEPEDFTQRVTKAGFLGVPCAENIAMGGDADATFQMWLNSKPHYVNMMGDFNLCGIGNSGSYWTLLLVKATVVNSLRTNN